jgi:hypothetical protein
MAVLRDSSDVPHKYAAALAVRVPPSHDFANLDEWL